MSSGGDVRITRRLHSGDNEHVPLAAFDSAPAAREKVSYYLLLVVFFSAITGLLMGFDLSIIAVVLNPIQEQFALCKPDEFTCFRRELFVSMIAPGALVGSLGGGWFADRFGRRWTLAISDLAFIAGSLTFYFAKSFTELLIARVAIGVGVGIGFVVFSTYVTEISPAYIRGRLVVCQEIAQCIGVLLTFLVASIIGDSHWRILLTLGGAAALVQLFGIFLLPESPRWLLMQNNVTAARATMAKLGMNDAELFEGAEDLKRTGSGVIQHSTIRHFFDNRRAVAVACFVGVAQNILCTNAALYYSTDLFLLAGVCKPFQWGIGLGVMKLVGTLIVYNMCDRIGRKPLLLFGTVGLGLVNIILAVAFGISPYKNDIHAAAAFCQSAAGANLGPAALAGAHSITMLVGIFGLVFFWELSWASLMYVVASEIIPSAIRGVGMGLVVFVFWISLFISQLVFEWMFILITISGTFLGLSLLSIFIALITHYTVPDMTGKTLESINRMMSQSRLSIGGNRNGDSEPRSPERGPIPLEDDQGMDVLGADQRRLSRTEDRDRLLDAHDM